MKKFALPFISGIVVTLACLGVLILPFFRSPTRNANCLPIRYPEHPYEDPIYDYDITAFQPYVLRTKTSLQTIKDFYDTNLLHGPNSKDDSEGYWMRFEVRPGEFLYECGGNSSFDETETGCVYLRVRDGATIVERIWLDNESTVEFCEYYISELPANWYVNDSSK